MMLSYSLENCKNYRIARMKDTGVRDKRSRLCGALYNSRVVEDMKVDELIKFLFSLDSAIEESELQ